MKAAPWLLLLWSSLAAAEPEFVLRFATVAPDGSIWARNLRAMAQEVDAATDHNVRIKLYFGGMAGDELEQRERLIRGQLDGVVASLTCDRFLPSLRVQHLAGLFQRRDEARVVMNKLQPIFEREAHQSAFVLLGTSGVGSVIFFTRVPVHNLDELRKLRLWRWDVDDSGNSVSRAMGFHLVPLPIADAAAAYDRNELDGFISAPTGALAFQWPTRARYVEDLRADWICGCALAREDSFFRMPLPYQRAIRSAMARAGERNEEETRRVDEALLGGMFQKQGVQMVPISERLRSEFFVAAREARGALGEKLVSKELLFAVQSALADLRAEQGAR
jgi:TRAP-type C4-dicarboxylate transport system substrate-binding protein